MPLTEDDIETIALEWFAECGYEIVHGPDIAPEMPGAERASYEEVLLVERLKRALVCTQFGIIAYAAMPLVVADLGCD